MKLFLSVTCSPALQSIPGVCGAGTLQDALGAVITWLIGLVGFILVITILVSAIQIVTSGGSPDAISGAKKRLSTAAVSLVLLLSLSAIVAIVNTAFTGVEGTIATGDVNASVTTLLANVTNILLGVVGAMAVVFIIVGGIQYVTAGGNSGSTEKAKKTITYAVGGLVLALSIGVIMSILRAIFT